MRRPIPQTLSEWVDLASSCDELRFPLEARDAVMQSLRAIVGHWVPPFVSGKPILFGPPIGAFYGDLWH